MDKQVRKPSGVVRQSAPVAEYPRMSQRSEHNAQKAFPGGGKKMSLPAAHPRAKC